MAFGYSSIGTKFVVSVEIAISNNIRNKNFLLFFILQSSEVIQCPYTYGLQWAMTLLSGNNNNSYNQITLGSVILSTPDIMPIASLKYKVLTPKVFLILKCQLFTF